MNLLFTKYEPVFIIKQKHVEVCAKGGVPVNIKQKISGMMSLFILLMLLNGALFPQIRRYFPSGADTWQVSAARLHVAMQDCRTESEHTQMVQGAIGGENGTGAFAVRLRLLLDLLLPCSFLMILWPLFCTAKKRRVCPVHKKLFRYLQCTDLP